MSISRAKGLNKSKMLVASEGYHHQRSSEQKCYMSAGEFREIYRKEKSNSSRANFGKGRSIGLLSAASI